MAGAGSSYGATPQRGHDAYSPYGASYPNSPPRGGAAAGGDCMGVHKVEDLEQKCSLWRYRCSLNDIRDLEHVNSKYSDEFIVADVPWRIHLQQRTDPQTGVLYLAIHLQCVHTQPGGTYGHFKISVVNRDFEKTKGKNFHCHFKKPGSAWGLHHFIQLERLLQQDSGFVDRFEEAGAEPIQCVSIEVLLKVIDPGLDGTYVIGQLPKPTKALHAKPAVNAKLQWPADEALADLFFQFADGSPPLHAHRCVVQARCPRLLDQLDKQEDAARCVISLPEHMGREVFNMFLHFVYTEEGAEGRGASAESLIDLYRLAMDAEYYGFAEKCLALAGPLITVSNILELLGSRYSEQDEALNVLFLRVLSSHYDQLIEDPNFERIPGRMNRKLAMMMRAKDNLGDMNLPRDLGRTLSIDLGQLAKEEHYADIEVMLPGSGAALRLHKIILMNRAVQCANWQGPSYEFPAEPDYAFSDESFRAFFQALYRGTLESPDGVPVTPELITLTMKMDDELQLTGDLRRECEAWVSPQNCLPLYVLAQRHRVPSLSESSKALLSRSLLDKLRAEPDHVWQLLDELPREGVLDLLKGFTDHLFTAQPR